MDLSDDKRYTLVYTCRRETMITKDPVFARDAAASGEPFVIYNGDCRNLISAMRPESVDLILSSPPYFMGKSYDRSVRLEDFISDHQSLAPELVRILKLSGNLAWQVGNYVFNGELTPLDFVAHGVFSNQADLKLRNRIVWTFGHGAHAQKRFSGRHETVLWYSKGNEITFNLDEVRVPQKYPGKRHYKGPKKGQWSGNPLGKNPGDVWDIPNVKANHVEKTAHPCQFPVALAERLIRALTQNNQLVFDPFCGVASSGVGAAISNRRFIGAELDPSYCNIAESRWRSAQANELAIRPLERPVAQPDKKSAVARDPFDRREKTA
ncbi:DNA-methyltransferase [Pseudoroseicyclus sp. H15]